MADIYRKATEVWIWLGPLEARLRELIDTITALPPVKSPGSKAKKLLFADLLARPWFGRI